MKKLVSLIVGIMLVSVIVGDDIFREGGYITFAELVAENDFGGYGSIEMKSSAQLSYTVL